nr:MAG TPA: hypothetical protein [Bacteriophage sp.]
MPLDILYNDISCIILNFPFSSSYFFLNKKTTLFGCINRYCTNDIPYRAFKVFLHL